MDTTGITGHLILLMGPTGSGKGTLEKYVFNVFPKLKFAVSCTTREMRPGEQEGVNYCYLSNEEFEQKINKGDFLEWAEFSGNKYGTLKSEVIDRLKDGEVVLNEIELQGVLQLMELIPKQHLTLIYVEAGSWEVLKARAQARAPISEEHLELRRQRYEEEIKMKPYADIVIENFDSRQGEATAQLETVVAEIFSRLEHTS